MSISPTIRRGATFAMAGAVVVAGLVMAYSSFGVSGGRSAPVKLSAPDAPWASSVHSLAARSSSLAPERAQGAYGRLPLAFEPVDRDGSFLARGAGARVSLDGDGAVFALRGKAKRSALLRMDLVGGRSGARLSATQRLPGVVNEFLGRDRSRWRTNVPTFAHLSARNVYPGIDLAYHGRQGLLEYDFLLAPGADPAAIVLGFAGQRRLRLSRAGDLLLVLPGGELRHRRPLAYQDGRPVAARFVLQGRSQVGFALGRYDRSRPLLIDPTVPYSTYFGGVGYDSGEGIAVDGSGNAYVTGVTFSNPNPGADSDAFVTKFNAAGSATVYSTYLGGSGNDGAYAIALDASGNAYVTGYTTSSNFPTSSPFQLAYAGAIDGFVAKLNTAGNALVYSSYLGGSAFDDGRAVAVDAAGSAYVTGHTSSTNFPTANPAQPSNGGSDDAFVTKVNAAGSGLVYSTYFGGVGTDVGEGIAVDAGGNAYLTGSCCFSITVPADAYVTKFNAAGSATVYSLYLGGSNDDSGHAIALDSGGNAYVTGYTNSTDFPTATPFQGAKAGGLDAFVTKVNAAGSALVYSTYLGGSGASDVGRGIAVDGSGNAYVTGLTSATNFPTASPFQLANGGGSDAFVTKLNATGSALVYSSYLGGSLSDDGYAVAVDAAGSAYVTGRTNSTNFPTSSPAQPSYGGDYDAFVTKISSGTPTAVSAHSFAAVRSGRNVLLRWRTGTEAGLLGFHVYRQTGGPRVRLDKHLVPAAGGTSERSYSFRDKLPGNINRARYWLQELRTDGTQLWRGPARISS